MTEARVGRNRLTTVANMLMCCDYHRHLDGEPDAFAQRCCRRFVRGLGIERRERGNRGAQHVHRVGALDETDHVVDLRRQHARGLEFGGKRVELRAFGQFAFQKEVASFFEG